MVVLKRKTNEIEKYDGFENIIELDESRPFSTTQKLTASTDIYTPRKAFEKPKPSKEVMPKIKRESKVSPIAKESVSAKAKVLLTAYIIIAIVLAGVVIATGMAITEVGERNADLEQRIVSLDTKISQQVSSLERYSDSTYMRGKASEMDMQNIDEYRAIPLVNTVETTEYPKTTNWFDRLCGFLSVVFNN